MERGLTQAEVLKMVSTASKMDPNDTPNKLWKKQRNLIVVRLLYETFGRIGELAKVDLEDVEFEDDGGYIYIRYPKRKAVVKRGKHLETKTDPRYVYFSEDTKNLLIQYLSGRKAGPLFLTLSGSGEMFCPECKSLMHQVGDRIVCSKKGCKGRNRRLSNRQIQRIVGDLGRESGIERSVSPKDLREAGERHTDVEGADRDTTSAIAGHSLSVKERHYKQTTTEDLKRVVQQHHPFFKKIKK